MAQLSEMAEDLDRKPGARDGKPIKGTRRGGRQQATKTDTILLQGRRSEEADLETGLVPGVTYSVNKGKRWEMVEELKSKVEDEEGAKKGEAVVVEVFRGRSEAGSAEQERHGQVKKTEKERAKKERQKQEAANEEPAILQTRRGPEVKKNVKQKQIEGETTDADTGEWPERVFLVDHMPGEKGTRICTPNRAVN